jgi:hypothetical protein
MSILKEHHLGLDNQYHYHSHSHLTAFPPLLYLPVHQQHQVLRHHHLIPLPQNVQHLCQLLHLHLLTAFLGHLLRNLLQPLSEQRDRPLHTFQSNLKVRAVLLPDPVLQSLLAHPNLLLLHLHAQPSPLTQLLPHLNPPALRQLHTFH